MISNEVRCGAAALVDRLVLPVPWNLGCLVRQIATARGRPIQLLPTDAACAGVCGLWVATDTADYIAFPRKTSPPHREWIITHELGHVLHNHKGRPLNDDIANVVYDDWQEHQAEAFAAEVMTRAGNTAIPQDQTALRIIAALDPGDPVVVQPHPRRHARSGLLRRLWAGHTS